MIIAFLIYRDMEFWLSPTPSTQLPEMNTTEQIDEDTTFQFLFTHDEPQTSETATANAHYPSRVRRLQID